MKYSVTFEYQGAQLDKGKQVKNAENETVFRAVASSDALDRDKEVMLPKGVRLDNFLKNPVMLFIHNYGRTPVGKVLELNVEDSLIEFKFTFSPDEEGKRIQSLYEKGFMNAFSVGFYPKGYKFLDENTPDILDLPLPDGSVFRFDASKYAEKPRAVIHDWELLEISPVPVPANPEALIMRGVETAIRKQFGSQSSSVKQFAEHQADQSLHNITFMLKNFFENLEGFTLKGAIESVKNDTVEKEWDAVIAQGKMALWASADGTGEKDTINWGKYSEGFAFVDVDSVDKFTSYHFLHHEPDVDKESLEAVFLGVTEAMSELLSGKVNLSTEEKQEVYAHLKSHYDFLNKKAPELKDYTEEELLKIAKGEDVSKTEESNNEASSNEESSDGLNADFLKQVEILLQKNTDTVKSALSELESVAKIRSNVLLALLKELSVSLKNISQVLEKSNDETSSNSPEEGDKDFENVFSKLSDQLKMAISKVN